MAVKYKYNAFISYLRNPDKQIAIAIRNCLMELGAKKHLLRFRALEIFRDEASLAGQGGISDRIHRGMDNSRFFVLLARPEITREDTESTRNWVQKELEYWLEKVNQEKVIKVTETVKSVENGNSEDYSNNNLRIIICVMDGQLQWDDSNNDFIVNQQTCLHSILQGMFESEPQWIDFRDIYEKFNNSPENKRAEVLSLKDPDFLQKIAEVSGTIQNKSVDELIAEDRRRQQLWSNVLVAGVLFLIVLSGVAIYQYRRALRNQQIAQNNLKKYEMKRLEETIRDAKTYADAGGGYGLTKKNEMIDSAKSIIDRYQDDSLFTIAKKEILNLKNQ